MDGLLFFFRDICSALVLRLITDQYGEKPGAGKSPKMLALPEDLLKLLVSVSERALSTARAGSQDLEKPKRLTDIANMICVRRLQRMAAMHSRHPLTLLKAYHCQDIKLGHGVVNALLDPDSVSWQVRKCISVILSITRKLDRRKSPMRHSSGIWPYCVVSWRFDLKHPARSAVIRLRRTVLPKISKRALGCADEGMVYELVIASREGRNQYATRSGAYDQ